MVKAGATDFFYAELLGKKMKKNTWKQYWVVLREDKLVFISEIEQKIAGIVKLTEETTCKVLGRKVSKRSRVHQQSKAKLENLRDTEEGTYKFKLYGKGGVHLLKTDCKSSCEKWIEAISCAVQNLWANTTNSRQSASPHNNGKLDFKYRLQRNFKNTWASLFGYAVLSEEDEEPGKLEKHACIEGTTVIQTARLAKPRKAKWINFPKHLPTRGNAIHYGILIEDITD